MGNSYGKSSWNLELHRFLTKDEIQKLRHSVETNREEKSKKHSSWVEWFLVETALNTGLRVNEIVELKCKDIVLRDELAYLLVRHGKGDKRREVRISKDYQSIANSFFIWKKTIGEEITEEAPVLYSRKSKSHYSTRAMQYAFKRCIKRAGIDMTHSIHHLRHTYASLLAISSKGNVRLVQKQLGHSTITTTQVYIDLFEENIINAIENLF
jgi:integrase/recombinase XerD